MDTPLYIFEATATKEWTTLIIAIVATVIAAGVLIYLKRSSVNYDRRHYRQLGQMLMGFVLIISIGSIFGGIFNLSRLKNVKIYEDKVETGYGNVPFSDLKYVYLQKNNAKSFISPSIELDTTYLAYFEEKNGRSYVLSDEHYDVEKLVKALRPLLEKD